ncbi:MAG: ATP-binding protein, partial [Christensenellaceae bacterium]
MTKINQIQSAILSLGPGAYQKLMDAYLVKKFGFDNISTYGSHDGTDKTTRGTPDSFVLCEDGRFILMAYGTVGNNAFAKIEADIVACLDEKKTRIQTGDIKRIIACHTSTNLSPGQVKRLCSHFPDTILVGLSDLSQDLLSKYPGIAKEHLSVDIDTHQIFDVVDFVNVTSRNQYATSLDMPLLCREKEQSELLALIEEKHMVLVFGKSGVGKTRLVLEAAKEFAERNNWLLRIIRSNQEPIYNDLMTTFTDDADYIVVVDDADQLVQLEHLFNICINNTRKHKLKVVMTVRDYAKEKLIHMAKAACQPGLYELLPMSDDSIGHVLSKSLGIKNQELIKHIQFIAKGSIRLAIMAGSCAVTGDFGKIENTFDIFEHYYSGIIETLDKHELLVAGLVAFFDSFRLQEDKLPLVVARKMMGIPTEEFKDICHTLHGKEVISIFENQAVKFENQNLRDYLLYLVFYKEKWLTPSYMILSAFPAYRKRIVFAFNTLLQLFDTQGNREYLVKEIKKAWAKIKNEDNNIVFEFVEVFHTFIPDDTLLMVKREIERLPAVHVDFKTFDFEGASNNHRINSRLIQLLIKLKDSDRFMDAIRLSLSFLEKNTERPMDFYFLFGENWGFDHNSYKNGFDKEKILIEQLTEYYTNNGTIEAALCLCFAVSHCLKFCFSTTESNRDNTVTMYQFTLPACHELLEVRTQCIKAIALLWVHPEYQKYAASIIQKYPERMGSQSDKEIFENDLAALNTYLLEYLNPAIFTHCLLFERTVKICKMCNMTVPCWLEKFSRNNIYRLYRGIEKYYLLESDNIEDAETERKNHIAEICRDTENEEFALLWNELVELEQEKGTHDEWKIGIGIDAVFSSLADDWERFLNCAGTYLRYDTPFGLNCRSLVTGLINILGYRSAVDFIAENSGKKCEQWLTRLYNLIPDYEITSDDANLFIEILSAPPTEAAAKQVIELPLV